VNNQRTGSICRRVVGLVCLASLVVAATPTRSSAQMPFGGGFGAPASTQINNPAVSPYLTLTQPGINPGVAFNTLVLPQQQLGNAVMSQQQQIGNLQNGFGANPVVTPLAVTTALQTGHATAFMNTSSYFPAPNLRGGR
jgi:hypothetical protein